MSFLLAGAKRIENAAGARAGLHAYRALAERAPSADTALAHLAAMRCAAAVGDDPAFHKLLLTWPSQPGPHIERVTALAHRLALEDKASLARILLEAERTRWSDADRTAPAAGTALYLAAALAPGEGRGELLRRLAATTADAGLAARASLRLAELACAKGQTAVAADAARGAQVETVAERIRRADLALLSGSRFARAAAFSDVADLVALDETAALRTAIRGFCCLLPVLTPLEEDRVRAVFARLPDEARRDRWLEFVDACCRRARDPNDAPSGDEPGARSALDLQWLHVTLHDLVTRLRQAAPGERAPLERRFAALVAMGAAPARGFLAFARVIGDPALRRDLVLRAEAAGEPHARDALIDLVHAETNALLQAGNVAAAYLLTERAVLARRAGDVAAIRTALANPAGVSR